MQGRKQLREQFDDSFPDRDRTSDGWVADARHVAGGKSDHIPSADSATVRAIDIDRDVSGKAKPDLMPNIADQIRLCAKAGDKRISYIIFNGRIASSRMGWRWRKYSEATRITIIAISLSLQRAIQTVRSLIYPC